MVRHSSLSALATPSLALLALLQPTLTAAQQLLVFGHNALPTCANQCAALTQAQAACVPPAAPVTNQATYESCFCQSGYLTQIKTNPSALCGSACTAQADLTQITQWYAQNCVNNGADAAAQATTVVVATTAPGAAGAQATTSVVTSSVPQSTAVSSSSNDSSSSHSPTWWSSHWKWVVMLIVIFVGIAALAIIGVWLRRRHRRNRDKNTASFNAGITTRSAPMGPAPGSRSAFAPGSGRATPASTVPYGAAGARSESRLASAGNLSRVGERDLAAYGMNTPEHGGVIRGQRGGTPASEMEQGRVRNKGKGRMDPDVDNIGPVR